MSPAVPQGYGGRTCLSRISVEGGIRCVRFLRSKTIGTSAPPQTSMRHNVSERYKCSATRPNPRIGRRRPLNSHSNPVTYPQGACIDAVMMEYVTVPNNSQRLSVRVIGLAAVSFMDTDTVANIRNHTVRKRTWVTQRSTVAEKQGTNDARSPADSRTRASQGGSDAV